MARSSRCLAAMLVVGSLVHAGCSSASKKPETPPPDPLLSALAGTWTSCGNDGTSDVLELISFMGNSVSVSTARFTTTTRVCGGAASSEPFRSMSFELAGQVPVRMRVSGVQVQARAIDAKVVGEAAPSLFTVLYLDTSASPPVLYTADDPAPGDPLHDGSSPEKRHWLLNDERPLLKQPTYRISGALTGPGSAGVFIRVTGVVTTWTATNELGAYSVYHPGLVNGTYRVTPQGSGVAFAPASREVTLAGADVTGVDFTSTAAAPTYGISGTITGASGAVTVSLTGPSDATTTTTTGSYAFAGLGDGAYTVTPSAAGYSFSPPSHAVTIAGADQPGKDFTATADGPLTPFDAWERVVAAVRTSPDHLPARAAALVAQGDPAAIHAFVRDEIVTDPPGAAGFANAETAVRWGPRGTLRGGTGTPREKAELLAKLYRDAGFEATVVRGAPDAARVSMQAAVLRPVERRFAPVLDEAQVSRWMDALGLATTTQPLPVFDPAGTERVALAGTLASMVPAPSATFDWSATSIPLVRVRVGDQLRHANPLVPGAAFGESLTGTTSTAGAITLPSVRVRLEAATASAPTTMVPMVERTWTADEVVGRRVVLGFAPLLDPASFMTTRAADVSVLVPTLRVEAPDLDPVTASSLSAVGQPFSTAGTRFTVDEAGVVTADGASLGAGETAPAALAAVASAQAQPDAGQFPVVKVRVSARDAAGQQVPGLGADAFTVREDGQALPFTLTQNQAPPPRVVLLVDASQTVTAVIPRAQLASIGLDVARAVLGVPQALVRVGVVYFGIDWMGGWVGTEAAVQTQLDAMQATAFVDSELWKALSDVRAAGPTAVVLLTDADPEGDVLDAIERQNIASGAPVLAVGVGATIQANLDLMASLSGGRAVTVGADTSAASAAAIEFTTRRAAEDYVLTYRAPRAGAATRNLTIGIDGGRVSAAAQYAVPAEADRTPVGFARLELKIRIGTVETRRVLAGLPGTHSNPVVTQAMVDEVMEAFFGKSVIAVEAGPPLPAVVFEEILREKLAMKPLWEAARAGDVLRMEALLAGGLPTLAMPLYGFTMRTTAEYEGGYATFPTAMHATMFTEHVTPGTRFRRGIDLVASSRWASAGADPAVAWRKTLERTAVLALHEAAAYPVSTRALLDGLPLQRIDSGSVYLDLAAPNAVKVRWYDVENELGPGYSMLLPQGGTPFACWAVHGATGTVIGVLPDGSGGGGAECLEWSHPGDDLLAWAVGKLVPIPGVGVWLELEKAKARVLRRATIVIATGRDPGDLYDFVPDVACRQFWKYFYGQLPGGAAINASLELSRVFTQVMTLLTSQKWQNPVTMCPPPPADPGSAPPRWCL